MPWIIISSRKLVYLTDSSLYFFRTNFSFWFKEYRVFPESSSTSFKQAILVTEVGTSTLLYSTFSLITTCISIFECASSACAVSNFLSEFFCFSAQGFHLITAEREEHFCSYPPIFICEVISLRYSWMYCIN